MEAMSDGGVRAGLPRALSTELVTQTLIGAARLVQETGKHPAQVVKSYIWFKLQRLIIHVGHLGSKSGTVVRGLASHQCGPDSTPGVDAICGLSLLLVLSLPPRRFSQSTLVFPSPQKPTVPNSNSIWNARTRLNEFI